MGTVAVFFGIHIAGVGWPYYPLHILLMAVFLFAPAAFVSSPVKQVRCCVMLQVLCIAAAPCAQRRPWHAM